MFGAYQAGAWAELERWFKPDLVVGASIGALNGWMIAGGASAAQLMTAWLEPPDTRLRRLNRDIAEHHARRIFEGWQPRIPYGLVTTEFPSMRQRLFCMPELTWRHLAGSTAIPLIFRHQHIDGGVHADGGLITPLPLWAAIQMGAKRIIAINVLKHRPLYIRAIASACARAAKFAPQQPPEVEVIEIAPSERIGTLRQSIEWSRERSERWIDLGRRDARAVISRECTRINADDLDRSLLR
jgi:predicted acylesterase/phospholipase RssA